MTTFYLDLENGNDASDGTSFANRWKTFTSGATAARIAPGDTIRVMGSPAPTSLGVNATWTGQKLQATNNISSSTNASPISVSVTGHGYSTGDTVVINSHTTNTNANGTWEITVVDANTFTLNGSTGNGVGGATGSVRLRTGSRVLLASALTQNIASCGNRGGGRTPTWTQSTNVTTSQITTTLKEGDVSDSIAIAAAFTTGLAAFVATGTLNLSGYQGVSFWVAQTAGTVTVANDVELILCTDTAGTTAVHHVPIPALGALNSPVPVYWDNGSALNSAIKSIAFKVLVDRGAVTFAIADIIAVKASSGGDNLNLTSLIGKNNGTDTWYGIQSINGTRVMLDNATSSTPTATNTRGYIGATETVTTYKRETIKLAAQASNTSLNTVQDSGTNGNPITFEGGYDRTNMSTKTLETSIDGQNGVGIGINTLNDVAYISIVNFGGVRLTNFIASGLLGSGCYFDLVAANNCSGGGLAFQNDIAVGQGCTLSIRAVNNNATVGVNFTAGVCVGLHIVSIGQSCNNVGPGILINSALSTIIDYVGYLDNNTIGFSLSSPQGPVGVIKQLVSASHNTIGISFSRTRNWIIENAGVISDNSTGVQFGECSEIIVCNAVTSSNGAGISGFSVISDVALINCSIGDSVEYSVPSSSTGLDEIVSSYNHDQIPGNHVRFVDGGQISSATDQRHTGSGISWKFTPTATYRDANLPLRQRVGHVGIFANTTTTISIWCRRDNTNINGLLLVRGGLAAGIPSDVTTSCSPSINTWTQYSLTVTPTKDCVIEVLFHVWDGVGTTNSFWIDDFTVV